MLYLCYQNYSTGRAPPRRSQPDKLICHISCMICGSCCTPPLNANVLRIQKTVKVELNCWIRSRDLILWSPAPTPLPPLHNKLHFSAFWGVLVAESYRPCSRLMSQIRLELCATTGYRTAWLTHSPRTISYCHRRPRFSYFPTNTRLFCLEY